MRERERERDRDRDRERDREREWIERMIESERGKERERDRGEKVRERSHTFILSAFLKISPRFRDSVLIFRKRDSLPCLLSVGRPIIRVF